MQTLQQELRPSLLSVRAVEIGREHEEFLRIIRIYGKETN